MSGSDSSPPSVPEETDCLVCGSGKSFTKNPILFCDGPGCDIPVHQKCYGVAVVPSGNWYCQRCEDRIPINNTPSCCCPQQTGAFKRTTIPNQYIHVACAHFHPDLDETLDPIAFSTSLTPKRICCLCKSDAGVCSKCCIDSCNRYMHVTCAQREDLMTKGKHFEIFCENHKDDGVLRRIMKSQSRSSTASSSSKSSSLPSRATKRSKSYRETSSDSEEEDEDGDHDEDEDQSDSDDDDVVMVEDEDEDDRRDGKSAMRAYTKSKRLTDSSQRRKKNRSSESEEIDVDDTEAILGSSAGGGGGGSASMGQMRRGKVAKTNTKESAAEAQRRRLLQSLDKSKKRQSTGGLEKVTNLSAMPIRTLGGVGPAATIPSILGSNLGGSEAKQKLPGISRYNSGSNSTSNLDGSPLPSSADRFSNSGYAQTNGRNSKGQVFELDPSVDAATLKSSRSHSGSAAPSPTVSTFPSSGSPTQSRLGERQQPSPRIGYGATAEETREMQATIQTLQAKVTMLENTIQNLTLQQHGHHQQSNNATPPSGSSSSSSTPTMSAGPLAVNPYATGPTNQDLQHKFNRLQHSHGEEKMRNLTLRENLKDLFGYLQVPVASPALEGMHGHGGGESGGRVDWNAIRIDDYVQALRDAVVGPVNASPSAVRVLDTKRRDTIVDKVMSMYH
ncbi:Zinc finger protein zfp-1 [Mortierella alpina]|nr:Zinc finger protein zfp-1 [Mortierella alpina]